MNAMDRRNKLAELLRSTDTPVSASALAAELSVSRQIIVGDVALLRAAGLAISATPRGYLLDSGSSGEDGFGFTGVLACRHTPEQLRDELYTVVDFGGTLIDVTVEHSLYGQLSGPLDVGSRYEADLFCQRVADETSQPLSLLTGGIHLHRIGCRDEATFRLIKEALDKKGYLLQ